MILQCTCNHAFQDEKYGKKMRVHNLLKNGQYKCTVCGNKAGNPGKVEAKKETK